jgi:hypothetical protein
MSHTPAARFDSGAPHLVLKRASELSGSVAQLGQAMYLYHRAHAETARSFLGRSQLPQQLSQ